MPIRDRRAIQRTGLAQVLSAAKQIINFDPETQLPKRPGCAAIGREDEGQRLGQVGRDVMQNSLLDAGLPDETKATLRQVAHSAVEQAAGAAAGAKSKI